MCVGPAHPSSPLPPPDTTMNDSPLPLHPFSSILSGVDGVYSTSSLETFAVEQLNHLHTLIIDLTLSNAQKSSGRLYKALDTLETLKIHVPAPQRALYVHTLFTLIFAHTSSTSSLPPLPPPSLTNAPAAPPPLSFDLSPDSKFKLPESTRSKLISFVVRLLTKETSLLLQSNRATPLTPPLLTFVINWRPLYASLVIDSPFLSETILNPPVTTAACTSLRAATVNLVHVARHFFPNDADKSATEIWNTLEPDIKQLHSCVSFRAQIMLKQFLPTATSAKFYATVLPTWMTLWSGVDNCMDWDLNWMTLFCRARKHVGENYDWTAIMRNVVSR